MEHFCLRCNVLDFSVKQATCIFNLGDTGTFKGHVTWGQQNSPSHFTCRLSLPAATAAAVDLEPDMEKRGHEEGATADNAAKRNKSAGEDEIEPIEKAREAPAAAAQQGAEHNAGKDEKQEKKEEEVNPFKALKIASHVISLSRTLLSPSSRFVHILLMCDEQLTSRVSFI